MGNERNEFGLPIEIIELNKNKSKTDIMTYQTLININETLTATSQEFGQDGVYGGSVGTFFIPEYMFSDEEIIEAQ